MDAFCSVGPAAVMMVALRMSVGRDGNGLYVLANGLSFGRDTDPGSTFGVESAAAAVELEGVGAGVALGVAAHATPTAQQRRRLSCRIQY
jgi:hypothetical protein